MKLTIEEFDRQAAALEKKHMKVISKLRDRGIKEVARLFNMLSPEDQKTVKDRELDRMKPPQIQVVGTMPPQIRGGRA